MYPKRKISITFQLFLISCLIVLTVTFNKKTDYLVGRQQQQIHIPAELTGKQFLKYGNLTDKLHLREAVRNILVKRVVGTANHGKVREYIVKSLSELNWNVELDKFYDSVPFLGRLHFQNIIGTLNPNAERYLVLACHYDSKYMPDINFVGATDSAVPCAMLLNLIHVLQSELNKLRDSKLSLMLIFFDGEEAFDQWGPKDSLYGSRHLAEDWQKRGLLDRIDIFVLLDLLGAPDPQFYSYFSKTELWYERFIDIEDRLYHAGLFENYDSSSISLMQQEPNRYFQLNAKSHYIEDDHKPFLERNVPILHLISNPYPSVWHTEGDNASVIDYKTTENLLRILRIFTLEYLLPGKSV